MIPWVQWLDSITEGQSVPEISTKIGSNPTTFNRWKRMDKPPCEAIIVLAVAYGGDVIVGLVVSGHLPRKYVERSVEERLMRVPTVFLTNELARRAEHGDLAPALPPEWE
jgi:hypothetical protein